MKQLFARRERKKHLEHLRQSSAMTQNAPETIKEGIEEQIKEAQLTKLRLEISSLKRGNSDRFGKYLPFISVMVAVCGFLVGLYQFQKNYQFQQEKILTEQRLDRESRDREQEIRNQNQVRTNLERIAGFSKDPRETLSTVRLLLTDLGRHVQFEAQTNGNKADTTKRLITDTLLAVTLNDCDFNQPRDLLFVQTVSAVWPDYKAALKKDVGVTTYILAKYREAIKEFFRLAPEVLQRIIIIQENWYHPKGYGKLSFNQILQLHDALEGYRDHMECVQGEARATWIKEFERATGNPALTKSFLGQ